jgi:hypothetical protein
VPLTSTELTGSAVSVERGKALSWGSPLRGFTLISGSSSFSGGGLPS